MSSAVSDRRATSFADQIVLEQDPSKRLPEEILFMIFSYLEPESLGKCQRVCSSWRQIAEDPHHFFRFAQDLLFSFNKAEAIVFRQNGKSNFLFYYLKSKWQPSLDKNIPLASLEYYKTEGGKKARDRLWEDILPEASAFADPLAEDNSFHKIAAYPYKESRTQILYLIKMGALDNGKDDSVNRPFFLACYFGDKEMIDEIMNQPCFSQEGRNIRLLMGILMAMLGSKEEVWVYLDSMGVDYSEQILGLTFLDFIKLNIKKPEMAELLKSGMEFLQSKGAPSRFNLPL